MRLSPNGATRQSDRHVFDRRHRLGVSKPYPTSPQAGTTGYPGQKAVGEVGDEAFDTIKGASRYGARGEHRGRRWLEIWIVAPRQDRRPMLGTRDDPHEPAISRRSADYANPISALPINDLVLLSFEAPLAKKEIANDERIYAGIVVAAKRFARVADDRFAFDIEGRIQHQVFAGKIAEMPNEVVETGIGGPRDGLGSKRAVHMDNCGHLVALRRFDVE